MHFIIRPSINKLLNRVKKKSGIGFFSKHKRADELQCAILRKIDQEDN